MIKILANDGIDTAGKKILSDAGFDIITEKIPQEKLAASINEVDAILVRSATKVTQEIIEANSGLRLIGRAGVGMDNIDIEFAKHKGIKIINTPEASSQSVAELVFAHLFTMARMLHDSNREMPGCDTKEKFEALKKKYSSGIELRGKTLGIIGFGKIGQATARIALGLGMNVMPFKLHAQDVKIEFDFFQTFSDAKMMITMKCVPFEKLLAESDFITLHVPFPKGAVPVITKKEFDRMKDGVGLVNTARGGVVVEEDLLEALDSGKVAYAALDVFKDEPVVRKEIREHPKISLSPHIGGSTKEAQERIGIELASKVVQYFKGSN